jgi:dihydroorotase
MAKSPAIGTNLGQADRVIDASNCYVTPGLIDIHVHFREPGDEEEETVASGRRRRWRGDSPPSAACPTPNRRWITRGN